MQMEQTCTQFKCGIRGYMDEENPFAIRVGPIDKKFNYAYSKGVEQADSVMLKPIQGAEKTMKQGMQD